MHSSPSRHARLNPVSSYRPPANYYDEFLDPDLHPRPHWQAFTDIIHNWEAADFNRRKNQLDRIIRDNGITYNVYSEKHGESRPWTMDMLPLIYSKDDWDKLGDALAQRAELLNLIFKDVYGSQSLLKSNLLPPYLVLSNPHFCRPCYGLTNYNKYPLHIYAADLARSPDGNWWVLNDRLEASSGLGYALENRFISARIFPGVMRQLGVKRLNEFIAQLCTSYERLAPFNKDHPRIVLLTPGPANETYFEQSYLARNLGFTLVEGADLTVRENRVYLKTISGVKEVDVIIRRVDSAWCDPLELRNDSILGIPGLVDVLREGRVAIANALGASLLESAAIPAFLPSLCQQLLGEDLKIPSAATWWCGQAREKTYVLANLNRLVLKPTFRDGQSRAVFGPNLSASEIATWQARIERNPKAFSAQEMVAQATTPVYQDGSFHARHFLMRVYLAPTDSGWKILPGGLARIASGQDPINVSMQQGGESKDVWVIDHSKQDENSDSSPAHVTLTEIRRGSFDLPSRVADNFFWLGRYAERTEGLTRVLQCVLESLIEQGSDTDMSIVPLFNYFLDTRQSKTLTKGNPPSLDMENAEKKLSQQIGDTRNPESLVSNLSCLTTAATKVKERFSTQTWQQLLHLNDLANTTYPQRYVFDEETTHMLTNTLDLLAGFNGLMMDNMTRGQNWLFLELGKRVERILVLCNLLHSTLTRRHERNEEVLRKLLNCADSSMTYRRRYLTHLNTEAVVDLLVLEKANPRSLAFQAEHIQQYIKLLPHSFLESAPSMIDFKGLSAFSRIGLANPKWLLASDRNGRHKNLIKFLSDVAKDIIELAARIEQQYFAHTASALHPSRKRQPLSD